MGHFVYQRTVTLWLRCFMNFIRHLRRIRDNSNASVHSRTRFGFLLPYFFRIRWTTTRMGIKNQARDGTKFNFTRAVPLFFFRVSTIDGSAIFANRTMLVMGVRVAVVIEVGQFRPNGFVFIFARVNVCPHVQVFFFRTLHRHRLFEE